MSNEFTKYHLNPPVLEEPFDFWPSIHRFADVDKGGPHDHPFDFVSTVLRGGYIERIWEKASNGLYRNRVVFREPGETFFIKAEHIHEIITLPNGPCTTMIVPQPHRRMSGFWQFIKGVGSFRTWKEQQEGKPFYIPV